MVAVGRDVFDGGDGAVCGLVEGGAVGVEELVVEGIDDGVVDCLLDLELELRGVGGDRDADGWLDFVVVAVSGGVAALAEEVGVFLIAHAGGVEAVGCGELEGLTEEDGVGVVCLVVHFDGMVRGELPMDGVECRFEVLGCG